MTWGVTAMMDEVDAALSKRFEESFAPLVRGS